jgi:uncharacterized protein
MASLPEESITFACQECGKSITLPAYYAGHVGDCPECGSYVDVPRESEQSSPRKTRGKPAKNLDPTARTNAQLWFEVSAVLCLALLPWLANALIAVNVGGLPNLPVMRRELYQIIDAVQVSMPLLLIMALVGDSWSLFGIVRPKWMSDTTVGCVICFCCIMSRDFVTIFLPRSLLIESVSLHGMRDAMPEGAPEYLALFIGCVASGFAQELIFRGYLIARFERILRSTTAAVVVTTAMFASFHIYQGTGQMLLAGVLGFVFAIAFCLFRRLWPLCFAHALYNFLVLLHFTR